MVAGLTIYFFTNVWFADIAMISMDGKFIENLERKVHEHLAGQHIGYLLGAGSSYLNGDGYPLTLKLWETIRDAVPAGHRDEIQHVLDSGAKGLEHAMDLLYEHSTNDFRQRESLSRAVHRCFARIHPPLDCHMAFVRRLSHRQEHFLPVFSLNYDRLIERAAEFVGVPLIDGFSGSEHAFFAPNTLHRVPEIVRQDAAAGPTPAQGRAMPACIYLMKLHGSIGWYNCPENGFRRCGAGCTVLQFVKPLMVPPQHRKALETAIRPYSILWSEFRSLLCQDTNSINRLVTIGYAFRDEQVNAIIRKALARGNFTLLVFACELHPAVFTQWRSYRNAIIVTNTACSLNGVIGPGHQNLWSFERLCEEV